MQRLQNGPLIIVNRTKAAEPKVEAHTQPRPRSQDLNDDRCDTAEDTIGRLHFASHIPISRETDMLLRTS